MKTKIKIISIILSFVLALTVGLVAVACFYGGNCTDDGNNNGGGGNNNPPNGQTNYVAVARKQLQRQVDEAIELQENFMQASELGGGFIFGTSQSGLSGNISALNEAAGEQENEAEFFILEFVREMFSVRDIAIPIPRLSLVNTYINDVFMYNSVKQSLLNTYDYNALKYIFELEFDRTSEWNATFRPPSPGFQQFVPEYASFAGVNEETGKVYALMQGLEQSIGLGLLNSVAYIEYFFNEYNDFGVTTLTRRYNNDGQLRQIAFHNFDALTQTTLQIDFEVSPDGSLRLIWFGFNNVWFSLLSTERRVTQQEAEILSAFVLATDLLIRGTVNELEQENLRLLQIIRDYEEEQENENNEEDAKSDNNDLEYEIQLEVFDSNLLVKPQRPYLHLVYMDFSFLRIMLGNV